ncbi:hypothetical protein NIES4071_106440 (plasmid) [Calothrix sp. NIES-4071]|nr:hypothetical protein NIES4071_106440 [Calothrix sp. NIES-4071]BAZ65062.1 hypothetical protein NIES4105_107950 [Calothrix sp. NIES-4105]
MYYYLTLMSFNTENSLRRHNIDTQVLKYLLLSPTLVLHVINKKHRRQFQLIYDVWRLSKLIVCGHESEHSFSNQTNILEDKIMNNEINAIELSNYELDTVAGGLAITET